MAEATSDDEPQSAGGSLRTFLIADVRGYTRFSDENGDEAASTLARQFAAIVHDAVPPQGEVLELRGDEALCAFNSARAALWAAVEFQRRFRERVNGEPVLPLGVGIGPDAGEAVPTNGGYRGRALNVASRLCSLARPGEILASETVRNLAGTQEIARYAPRRPTHVKGVSERVRLVEVVPETELPPLPPAPPSRSESRVPFAFSGAAFSSPPFSRVSWPYSICAAVTTPRRPRLWSAPTRWPSSTRQRTGWSTASRSGTRLAPLPSAARPFG